MNKIYLYWFSKNGKYGNFGDELGPYLIQKLSGQKVYQIPIPRSSVKLILAYIKGLFVGIYSIKIIFRVIRTLLLNGRYIISVGSIIGWGSGKRVIWGSGILFNNEAIDNGKFLAVRGKYTQKRVSELGFKSPSVLGDPALLLPIVYTPKKEIKYELGFVPHHTQYEYFKNYQEKHQIKVINLLNDVEQIIDEIYSCEFIISTSLHGLIVAHAYGIPALWYEYPGIKWKGENIKFLDYFSSVDIPEYEPLLMNEIETFSRNQQIENIANNHKYTIINNDLSVIQEELLKVAPFKILDKYNHSDSQKRNR